MSNLQKQKYWVFTIAVLAVWIVVFLFHWLVGSQPNVKTLVLWFLFFVIGWVLASIASSVQK